MNNRDTSNILYSYVVLGNSMKKIADCMNLSTGEVSEIVRKYGFNKSFTGSWQSGEDRGKYKKYEGINITEDTVYGFVSSNFDNFEKFLESYYRGIIKERNAEADRKHREEEKRRKQAEMLRRQEDEKRRREEAYRYQEEQRHRREAEDLRIQREEFHRKEEERLRREEQKRLEEEARQRRRQEQIRNNIHIEWMNIGIKYCKEKNYSEALEYAEGSYELQPMNGNMYTIGVAGYYLRQYERAYAMVDHLISNGDYRVLECRTLRAYIYFKSSKGSRDNFLNDVEFALNNKMKIDDLLYRFADLAYMYGDSKLKDKAIEVYKLCINKGIELLQSNLALARIYYHKRMWQQTLNSYYAAEEACKTNDDHNIYEWSNSHWIKGISYYYLGDMNSAYSCFRNGLPSSGRIVAPYDEVGVPEDEEVNIFLDCLEKAGDRDGVIYYRNELSRRKNFLTGKTTAYDFYGDRYKGTNYRYVYDKKSERWMRQYVEQESIGSKLLNFFRL